LGVLLALVSGIDDERELGRIVLERIVEDVDVEVAALIRDGEVELALGYPAGSEESKLVDVGESASVVDLDGMGSCWARATPIGEETGLRVVLARRGTEPLEGPEAALVESMCRVVALGVRSLRLLTGERELRERSEVQADANARLLLALRERQQLLERLSHVQRAIVAREPLREVLEVLAEGACELLDVEIAVVMIADPDDLTSARVAASIGIDPEVLANAQRIPLPQVTDAQTGSIAFPDDAGDWGIAAGMAAPIRERGEPAGSMIVGSRDSKREFGARERDIVLALAEHASLALNHERAAREAAHEAFHDALTGLPNRSLLLDRIDHAVRRAERTDQAVAVLFCDLDGFKTVNDSLGHSAGDELLVLVGQRIGGCVRPADTVARLGGDEFAVLVEEIDQPSDAARAARRILEALEDPFEVSGREVYVGASIGIATGAGPVETLVRNADLAMYRAKSRGKGRYAVFEPEMHTAIVERLDLEIDLKRAIQNKELVLSYQPIYRLETREIAGLEALVRWQHPTRGLVTPDRFVPLAEESSLVAELGRWVLRSACHQAALWRAKYPGYTNLQVGVNISGVQLREPGAPADVADALADSGLDASGLILEITETALMEDSAAVVGRLGELKSLGVSLAVDDFGVGHSSLRYLKQFPLDNLKIDRAFVEELGREGGDPALVRAMVDLAQIFGLVVVAEGVERPEQIDALLELGCALGQGHFLSEPLEAAEADSLLLRSGLLGQESGEGAAGEAPELHGAPGAPGQPD